MLLIIKIIELITLLIVTYYVSDIIILIIYWNLRYEWSIIIYPGMLEEIIYC